MMRLIFVSLVLFVTQMAVDAREIFDAIQKGDLVKVKELVENAPDLATVTGNNRFTPLLFATNHNKSEIAEYLISKGANINEIFLPDYYGNTPISFAIKNGNLNLIKLLYEKGANIQFRTKLGENYLHFAAAQNKVDIAEYLIDCGIDINSTKNGGLTPLHIAVITGSKDVVELLLNKRAGLDIKSNDHGTPLHFAIASRNDKIADMLRKNGAKDFPGEFPEYKGIYLGKTPPGQEPEPFVPELFRDIYRAYGTPAFSPDGKELFFDGYFMPGVGYSRIWWMREENGVWTAPELAPFSDFPSWHPTFSPDGKVIFFASSRPPEGKNTNDSNLWYAEKQADGQWGGAKYAGSPPNRENYGEMLPVPVKDGSIYFKAFGPGSRGTGIYKSKYNKGIFADPVSLDDMIEANIVDDYVDFDHIISYNFGGPKGAEITICFHQPDGTWTKPIYMGDRVHQGQGTSNGRISPDRKFFFFVQNITPYWIDAAFIEDLRKEALKDDK